MYFIIYKITNTINGKFYIGKHQTNKLNDGYMGSGKLLKLAIRKYGLENFKKEILHIFNTEEEMNIKEKELVVISEMSYNLCEGGHGGFSYINRNNLNEAGRLASRNPEARLKKSATVKKLIEGDIEKKNFLANWVKQNGNGMLGKTHSDETKEKMSGPRGKYNVQKTGIKRGPYKKRLKST